MNEYYYYGLAAMLYLTTCWAFAIIRFFHTCREPKEHRSYIWPDRRLQVMCYLCATILLPYVINPTDKSAWILMKSYFPATYFFYCGMLLLCFFGTVKQWGRWKTVSWIAGIVVIIAMLPPTLNAWLPFQFISDEGMRFWQILITVASVTMMAFSGLAIWQVWNWIREARDANYSNPEDFPVDYARRVWLMPVVLTFLVWPAYLLDSPLWMAIMHVLLAIFNMVLLNTVLPAWRRAIMVPSAVDNDSEELDVQQEAFEIEERTRLIAEEIDRYVVGLQAFLDPHLKIDDVVAHTSYSRTYVSQTFQRCYGSFAAYVNGQRLAYYEQYVVDHPDETMESAALASGFPSYNVYYRTKHKK